MKRTLILDTLGEAVITTDDSYETISIIVMEKRFRGEVIPAKHFQLTGQDVLKDLHKFIGNVIQNNKAVSKLEKEVQEYQDKLGALPYQSDEYNKLKEEADKVSSKLKDFKKR